MIRLGADPTDNYEKDVGKKTDIRITTAQDYISTTTQKGGFVF